MIAALPANRPPAIFRYGRTSTDKQDDSHEVQKNVTERFLENGIALGTFDVNCIDGGYFPDECSGSVPFLERPAGYEMFSRARKGDHIVVAKLDRFSRNTSDFLATFDLCAQRDISIHILDVNIDTSKPMGRLLCTMLAAFAEFERSMISERRKARTDEIIERTGHHPRARYFGFKKIGKGFNQKFVVYEAERRWGEMFLDLYQRGCTIEDMTLAANALEIVRPGTKDGWTRHTIKEAINATRLGFPLTITGNKIRDLPIEEIERESKSVPWLEAKAMMEALTKNCPVVKGTW